MIKRYTPKKMGEIWAEQTKFQTWLFVELAVIKARQKMGLLEAGIAEAIENKASFTVEAIDAREAEIQHDLQAFVDVVRASLPEHLRGYVHHGLTSYDTEVPALAIQMLQACDQVCDDLEQLIDALRQKASEHMHTYCMGITHGQDAEPTTFGWRLCVYIDMLENSLEAIRFCMAQLTEVKCSGAVGNYLTISPELEEKVCEILDLDVRPAASQIVARDVFARLLSELATLGGSIEKMATDLRLMATTAYGEIQEPRTAKQKGSSAMPHKKNPIMLERMCGMSIMLRGFAVMGQELIRTWFERDIAHSSVERVAIVDAFCIADYMLQKMTNIMSNMVVNRERMAENIGRSFGCWASENVKLLLTEKGLDPESGYRFVQDCAFRAMQERTSFIDVLWNRTLIVGVEGPDPMPTSISSYVTREELEFCFDFVTQMKPLVAGYKRMELDASKALEPNVHTS